MFKGEFGDSCILRLNINQLLGDKFLVSLAICLTSLLFAYLIAIPSASSPRLPGAPGSTDRCVSSPISACDAEFSAALMIMLFSTVVFGDSLTGLFSKEYRDAEWSFDKLMDFLSRAWLPVFILGWSATAFALQTVRALMLDEIGKLYVTAASARGIIGRKLLWRYPARHALGPIVNSLGFDLNRIFNELPIVALILTLTKQELCCLNRWRDRTTSNSRARSSSC